MIEVHDWTYSESFLDLDQRVYDHLDWKKTKFEKQRRVEEEDDLQFNLQVEYQLQEEAQLQKEMQDEEMRLWRCTIKRGSITFV